MLAAKEAKILADGAAQREIDAHLKRLEAEITSACNRGDYEVHIQDNLLGVREEELPQIVRQLAKLGYQVKAEYKPRAWMTVRWGN